MNWLDPWLMLVPVGGLALLILAWRLLGIGHTIQSERARELFRLQKERFEQIFLKAAASTGSPRGLHWISCTFNGELMLGREPRKRQMIGLIPVTIQFEPIEGSDMEGLPAAAEARSATAVFVFERGSWTTAGRVIFNLTPEQSLQQFPGCERMD
jgi:hypothetical protein